MLLRGFAKGVPTGHQTDEMDLAYLSVLKRRHRIQEAVQQEERVGLPGEAPQDGPQDGTPEDGLPDPEVEADEMYRAEISADAGENPIRTGIRMIRPAKEPTKPSGGALTRTTGLRSWGWLAAKPGRPASGSVSTRRKKPFGGQLLEERLKRPASLPTGTAPVCGWKTRRSPKPAMPSTTLNAGPPAKMEMAFGRFTSVQPEGTRRACATAWGASAVPVRTTYPDT
jgi:hypothetical protein